MPNLVNGLAKDKTVVGAVVLYGGAYGEYESVLIFVVHGASKLLLNFLLKTVKSPNRYILCFVFYCHDFFSFR